MKKLLLIITMMMLLTGCQNKTIELNEEVKYRGWTFKLTNIEFANVIGAGRIECEATTNTFYDYKGLSMDCIREMPNENEEFLVITGELKYNDDTKSSLSFDLGIDKGEHYKSYIVDQEKLIFVGGNYKEDKEILTVNNPKEHNSFAVRTVYAVSEKDDNFIINLPFGYKYKVKRN
jgi:hypothetical protein